TNPRGLPPARYSVHDGVRRSVGYRRFVCFRDGDPKALQAGRACRGHRTYLSGSRWRTTRMERDADPSAKEDMIATNPARRHYLTAVPDFTARPTPNSTNVALPQTAAMAPPPAA